MMDHSSCEHIENHAVETKLLRTSSVKKSLWNWAPLRAIAKIRQQQFPCVFSITIQRITEFPSSLDGFSVIVQLEHKHHVWRTMTSRVSHGIAEFSDVFRVETNIYGRKVGIQNPVMKFMPKHLIVSGFCTDADKNVMFKHHCIDLSSLLPTSVDALSVFKQSMSSTRSFDLGANTGGALLVLRLDLQQMNEQLRFPKFPVIANASARYGDSPHCLLHDYNSMPNSANASPSFRQGDVHYNSPCKDSVDSVYIEKLDLSNGIGETEEGPSSEFSSLSQRFHALENDPLHLDEIVETKPDRKLEYLDYIEVQNALVVAKGAKSLEKCNVESLVPKLNTCQIDLMGLLGDRGLGNHKASALFKPDETVDFSHLNSIEVSDSDTQLSGKHCVGTGISEVNVMSNDRISETNDANYDIEKVCGEWNVMLSAIELGNADAGFEALEYVDDSERRIDVKEKHMLCDIPTHQISHFNSSFEDERTLCLTEETVQLSPSYEGRAINTSQSLVEYYGDRSTFPTEIFPIDSDDDLTAEDNAIAEDFLNLLEGEQNSSNAHKDNTDGDLHELEQSIIACCNSEPRLLPACLKNENFEADLGLLPIIEAAESEMKKAAQSLLSKERAKALEAAETQALVAEWRRKLHTPKGYLQYSLSPCK